MTYLSIERLILEVPGLSATEAGQLARQVGTDLAARAPRLASRFDTLAVTLDGLPVQGGVRPLAQAIVEQLLRQMG